MHRAGSAHLAAVKADVCSLPRGADDAGEIEKNAITTTMAPMPANAAVMTNSKTVTRPSSCCKARVRMRSWVDQNIIFIARIQYKIAATFQPMMARVTASYATESGRKMALAIPITTLTKSRGRTNSIRIR